MNKELLSTLGLCKRAGMLEAGEEPVESAARARDVRLLLLAQDAAENTARRAEHFAQMGQCILVSIPFTKEELGRAVGRESCALAGITDVGFACAVARRLADGDPQTYGDAAQRLEVKAQRAAQRRTEQALHEKNLRRGKKRRPGEVKAAVPQEPAEPAAKDRGPSGREPAERKPYGKSAERADGRPRTAKPYAGKPSGERQPFSNAKTTDGRKSYGSASERKPYAGKPSGERKPFSNAKTTDGRKPYGGASERKPYAGKPYGERKPFSGVKASDGRKPYGGASERKPYSGKPYGKPAGRFSHSRPVKHGKGSFPKKHD